MIPEMDEGRLGYPVLVIDLDVSSETKKTVRLRPLLSDGSDVPCAIPTLWVPLGLIPGSAKLVVK